MANHIDPNDENAIVFDGFQEGIAEDPYDGISDMRNANIISIPGEASVNFATDMVSDGSFTVNVLSSDATADTVTFASTPNLKSHQVVYFTASSIGGISTGTLNAGVYYWLEKIDDTTARLYTGPYFDPVGLVNITTDSTGTFSTVDMGLPKYFSFNSNINSQATYMVDINGRVWFNMIQGVVSTHFIFAGNKVPTTKKSGNGLVYYEASDGTGYMFVFHNSSIDYIDAASLEVSVTAPAWVYQWVPSAGTHSTYSASPTAILVTAGGTPNSHETLLGSDNAVYYCDATDVGRFYQKNPSYPTLTPFDPTDTSTYVFDSTPLLPTNDIAQCMAQVGTNILIGGKKNVIYPWNTVDFKTDYPIFLAERNVQKMVTVNTNVYALVGNRGRIYITNGSQAQLWKKVPDHLSGTVEPYYIWGGLCSQKNQIYFSFYTTTNSGDVLPVCGGIWAVDVDTEAIRVANELSYGTYAGYASALIPDLSLTPAGTGLFMGWYDGVSAYGVDQTVTGLYTNSQTYIDFEMYPIATFLRPKTFKTVEYKLSSPLVQGESVSIYYRKKISDLFTLIFTSSMAGAYSDNHPVNFDNAQWVQLRVILNSI